MGGISRRFHAVSDVRVCNRSSRCVSAPTTTTTTSTSSPRRMDREEEASTHRICGWGFQRGGHIMAELGCEWWIVLGCSDSWRGQTQCLCTTNPPISHRCFAKLHTVCSWMHCEPPSLPSSTPYYITLSLAPLCSATSVGFAVTLQTIYRFLSITIAADQLHNCGVFQSAAACWHQCCKYKSWLRKAFRKRLSLSSAVSVLELFG